MRRRDAARFDADAVLARCDGPPPRPHLLYPARGRVILIAIIAFVAVFAEVAPRARRGRAARRDSRPDVTGTPREAATGCVRGGCKS